MIIDPELGADVSDMDGFLISIPRRNSFMRSVAEAYAERVAILNWCAEQGIVLGKIDMTCESNDQLNEVDRKWEVFIRGTDAAHAVLMQLRWS